MLSKKPNQGTNIATHQLFFPILAVDETKKMYANFCTFRQFQFPYK